MTIESGRWVACCGVTGHLSTFSGVTEQDIKRQKADALLRYHDAAEPAHVRRRVRDIATAMRSVAEALERSPDNFTPGDDTPLSERRVIAPEPVGATLETETFGTVNMDALETVVAELLAAQSEVHVAESEARELGVNPAANR